jgi:hypothetical protein
MIYTIYDNDGNFWTVNSNVAPENSTESLYSGNYSKPKYNSVTGMFYESATNEEVLKKTLHEETQKYIQRTTDGVNAYAKISAEFRLAKLAGTIDDATHTYIENLLTPVRNEVLAGQWISAKQKLIIIGEVAVGAVLYDRLITQITTYITENY